MSNPAQPPVFPYQPPRKPQNTGPSTGVILSIVVCLGLGLTLLIGLATYAVLSRRTVAKPRAGMNLPIHSQKLGNGWYWFDLHAIGVRVASTCRTPKPVAFPKNKTSLRSPLLEYGGYQFSGRHLFFRVVAFYMKRRPNSVSVHANALLRQWKKSTPTLKNTTITDDVVGRYPGKVLTGECVVRGKRSMMKSAIVVVRNTLYYFDGSYFADSQDWSEGAYDYTIHTVQFQQ